LSGDEAEGGDEGPAARRVPGWEQELVEKRCVFRPKTLFRVSNMCHIHVCVLISRYIHMVCVFSTVSGNEGEGGGDLLYDSCKVDRSTLQAIEPASGGL